MARLVGINHVALEVGDVDAALDFYGRLFAFELRGRVGSHMAFVDAGDQFIALSAPRTQAPDDDRHVGLVVDDREAVRSALAAEGIDNLSPRGLRFRDPWGNQIEVVGYASIQFAKTPAVLRGMGMEGLQKTPEAVAELRERGLAAD
ncbi:MAG: VOC family protein [Solirubrobacteraceae bacterium]